jgi:hypothetical protein
MGYDCIRLRRVVEFTCSGVSRNKSALNGRTHLCALATANTHCGGVTFTCGSGGRRSRTICRSSLGAGCCHRGVREPGPPRDLKTRPHDRHRFRTHLRTKVPPVPPLWCRTLGFGYNGCFVRIAFPFMAACSWAGCATLKLGPGLAGLPIILESATQLTAAEGDNSVGSIRKLGVSAQGKFA